MKRYFFIALLAVSVSSMYGLSGALETELQYYNMAGSMAERLGIVREVANAKTPDAGEFYAVILDRLLREYPSLQGQELRVSNDLVRLLVESIGEEKYQDAGQSLWRAVDTVSDSMAKQSGLIALGKTGFTSVLPQVIRILSDLNTSSRSDEKDREDGNRIAYGAIIALENYRDPSGYLPVFFAANAWYSEMVKNRAKAALPQILEDPSEPLTSIIQGSSYSYREKNLALQSIEQSWVSNDKKSAVAVAALTISWRSSSADPARKRELVEMRKMAIQMIGRYGTEDASVYPLLDRTYKEGSEDEKFTAISTLASLASEDSVKLLTSYTNDLTAKVDSGSLTRDDERLIRVIVPALGRTSLASAGRALRSVRDANWTAIVRRLAADALKNLPDQ